MIRVEQINDKAMRLWRSGKVLQSIHGSEDIFPVSIPTGKPTAAELRENFAEVAAWVEALRRHSETHQNPGYRLQMIEINHRQFGKQAIPSHVIFDNATTLIGYIKTQKEAAFFQQQLEIIQIHLPPLYRWCINHPIKVIEHQAIWPKLIAVIKFFQTKAHIDCYIRELEIEGIDSKFIEKHREILTQLLDEILQPENVNSQVTGLAQHGFERRYGLKYDAPTIRFRCLDDRISQQFGGLKDIRLPLSEFIQLKPSWARVFITENKINGLSFPAIPGGIVLFGLGYGITMLKEVDWLADCHTHYWGDIDTHGFAILSQLRSYHPHTHSMLMDETTLLEFRSLWVEEPANTRFSGALANLSRSEQVVYQSLREGTYGRCVRLEQERISYRWVIDKLEPFT